MGNWRLWFIAVAVESVLGVIGLYLAATRDCCGAGIVVVMTQVPGVSISQMLLAESASNWPFYLTTAAIQIVVFSLVLHLLKFMRDRMTARPLK